MDTAHAPLVSATLVPGPAGASQPANVTAVLREPERAAHSAEVPLPAPTGGLSLLAPPETFLGLAPSDGAHADTGGAGGGVAAHSMRAEPCTEEQTAALQGSVRYLRDGDGADPTCIM